MTHWLVTGAAGFIGANFVRLACARTDARLVVLDALTYAGNLENIADLVDEGRIEFHRGDICDGKLVEELFARYRFDRVVHFAAESHVDRSILGAGPFTRTNIQGTAVLLDAARANWQGRAGGQLFLHVSTDEVFGSLEPGDPVTSVGCNHGENPTPWATQITAINRYQGHPNVEAARAPVEGRSGGGLFNAQGQVIGICYAAEPKGDEGLYASLSSIQVER